MGIPGSANPLLLAQQDTGYRVQRSIRLNSSDSAYLSRTPSSAGNRKTWTLSFWLKRGTLSGTEQHIFSNIASSLGAGFILCLSSANKLTVNDYMGSLQNASIVTTTAVFRDCSAWYHIHILYDTTQATAANRIRIFINGTEQTGFDAASYPTQNYDGYWNSTAFAAIGRIGNNNERYFDGYLAEIHFIDGQALTPSSFTEVSATTGQLIPKAYTGTYGTNGFKLDFADNSAATAAALGKDTSGNGNNWTPNNLSVTAGAGNDSLVDTPTSYGTDDGLGGSVRGNYATLNPLSAFNLSGLVNGNLQCSSGASSESIYAGTVAVSSGKWYWEVAISSSPVDTQSGVILASAFPLNSSSFYSKRYKSNGNLESNTGASGYGASYTNGDVIGVALDMDNGTLVFYKNGVSQGTAASDCAGKVLMPVCHTYNTTILNLNFGQRPFAYPVSGFKALCDTNLPTPVVAKPSTVFDVVTWVGNQSSNRSFTLPGSFSPDLIWFKNRSTGAWHQLYDTIRGTTKRLFSNATDAENTTDATYLTSFDGSGFTIGSGTDFNGNGQGVVAWAWDAGSSTVTNTQGSITSTVRANASAGFSIVTYSQGANNSTVGHGLGAAPHMIIAKSRTVAGARWDVFHRSLGREGYIYLDGTNAAATYPDYWGSVLPTSTTFGVSLAGNYNNTGNMVAYCFAPVSGLSAFGSYTGNGSADGPFVYTGFRPRWIICKATNIAYNWVIKDAVRSPYNRADQSLYPNLSDAEYTVFDYFDILSNGFKPRSTDQSSNVSGVNYIYFAVAESPFQYARAR